MSVPVPAIVHASTAPAAPVDAANCWGSANTPAPTIDPITSMAMVRTLRRAGAGPVMPTVGAVGAVGGVLVVGSVSREARASCGRLGTP